MFQGDILISKLEPVLSTFGYTMNQLDVDSFRMLFDLIVTSNGSMVGASGATCGKLFAWGARSGCGMLRMRLRLRLMP